MLRSGWFDGVAGIVVGAFTDCGPAEVVAAVLEDRLVPLGVPMVSAVDVGHTTTTLPIPLGVSATLDADHGRLTLAQPALA
jgi:muramoyltetrapeptide carboxypeptidase